MNKTYYPLELAYSDCLGFEEHYLIKSPVSFRKASREKCFDTRSDVLVTTKQGMSSACVYDVLRKRYNLLVENFPGQIILFGYKGLGNQARVLVNAGIPNIVNMESYDIPSLKELVATIEKPECSYHMRPATDKCALHAIRGLMSLLPGASVQEDSVLPLDEVQLLHESE